MIARIAVRYAVGLACAGFGEEPCCRKKALIADSFLWAVRIVNIMQIQQQAVPEAQQQGQAKH